MSLPDLASVLVIFKVITEGIGVIKELQELAKRVENGEVITYEEVENELKKNKEALDKWNTSCDDYSPGSEDI